MRDQEVPRSAAGWKLETQESQWCSFWLKIQEETMFQFKSEDRKKNPCPSSGRRVPLLLMEYQPFCSIQAFH